MGRPQACGAAFFIGAQGLAAPLLRPRPRPASCVGAVSGGGRGNGCWERAAARRRDALLAGSRAKGFGRPRSVRRLRRGGSRRGARSGKVGSVTCASGKVPPQIFVVSRDGAPLDCEAADAEIAQTRPRDSTCRGRWAPQDRPVRRRSESPQCAAVP